MLPDLTCEGWVVHRRRSPRPHEFRYPVWMLCVDAERVARRRSRWLSVTSRFAPLALRAGDYDASQGVLAKVNAQLAARGLPAAQRVSLLTQPRSWGLHFNPVSFYFCYRDEALCFVLAEINNTPWDEWHTYVLDARGQQCDWAFRFPKTFHVSPFMPMALEYHWRLRLSGESIEIGMRLERDGEEQFFAGLYLRAEPLSEAGLRRGALRYPWQGARTLLRIYWQALRLYLKRTPFFTHPDRLREAETQ
ncbi:MAG: DUF1365 domain-containing protein [Pseudomonadales bacterium]